MGGAKSLIVAFANAPRLDNPHASARDKLLSRQAPTDEA